jgi:ATP-dependent helicase/DNAse subunit B
VGNHEPQPAPFTESLTNLEAFVASHVHRTLEQQLKPHQRELMPHRYLELEAQRLTRLVCEWLNYEAKRIEFEVADTEINRTVSIAGLTLDLRLDRIDRLNDGSQLVIDYKSGNVSPKCWELPRPDDVQLPLYAGFALKPDDVLGGLVFAKVRPGDSDFTGQLFAPSDTLSTGLKGTSSLMKNRLNLEQLEAWRDCIQQLAKDFVAGHAEVDPRDPPKTCERCGLQTLCRIQEREAQFDSEDDSEDQEANHE